MAVALGISGGDPTQAAALIGLAALPGPALERIIGEAAQYRELTERRPVAVGALLASAIALLSIRLASTIDEIPVSLMPSSLRALAQAQELLTGSASAVYADVAINILPPAGA